MNRYAVTGMHRSGTSLVAEILEAAGCWFGPPELLAAPAPDNPRGFRENTRVVAVNDQLLAAVGAKWFDPLPVLDQGWSAVDDELVAMRTSSALDWTSSVERWAVKDPRLALTLPLWLPAMNQPTLVVPVRHPSEVARSLANREDLPIEVGLALWESYHVLLLEHSRSLKRVFVSHDRLLSNPDAEISRLLSDLANPDLSDDVSEIASVVDPDLRRAQRTEDDLAPNSQQMKLYEALIEGDAPSSLVLSDDARVVLERFAAGRDAPQPLTGGARNVAVIVQGCRHPAFQKSLDAMRDTWATHDVYGVDVFFAFGNACTDHELADLEPRFGESLPSVPDGVVVRTDNVLMVGCPDLIAHESDALLKKRLLALRYLLKTDSHDAFLLLCASSYVNQEVLAEHIQTMPMSMTLEGGVFVADATGRVLVSGSSMLMSRDLAQTLVDNAADVFESGSNRYEDDVTISDWVAANISDTEPEAMVERVQAGQRATGDNTFRPQPTPFLDYRSMPEDTHRPVPGAYHYHFDTDAPLTMRTFYDRYFAPTNRPQSSEATIFVQIAAYRDRELPSTISSALAKATHPHRLRFGVCWQYDEDSVLDLDEWEHDDRVRVDEIYYRKSEGCTWARNRANKLYEDEDYYLQIDAHTRFDDGWDTTLIDMLAGIDAHKPIISVYPPGYTIADDAGETFDALEPVHVLKLASINQHLQTTQSTVPAASQGSVGKSPLLAAGFIFAPGSFVREVPYDPFGYFSGEEISLAARAYTWGYDLFHPSQNVLWHRYHHGGPVHWSDHAETHTVAEARSRARIGSLLLGDSDSLGEYGLGPYRTVADFAEYCGIDFAAAARGDALDEPLQIDTQLQIDTDGIERRDDYDVWVFALLGADGRELLRQDIHDVDVLAGRSRTIRLRGRFDITPTDYLIWPRSKESGFGERRIRPLPELDLSPIHE